MDTLHKICKAGELMKAIMAELEDTEAKAEDVVGRIKKILRGQLWLFRNGVDDAHALLDTK